MKTLTSDLTITPMIYPPFKLWRCFNCWLFGGRKLTPNFLDFWCIYWLLFSAASGKSTHCLSSSLERGGCQADLLAWWESLTTFETASRNKQWIESFVLFKVVKLTVLAGRRNYVLLKTLLPQLCAFMFPNKNMWSWPWSSTICLVICRKLFWFLL